MRMGVMRSVLVFDGNWVLFEDSTFTQVHHFSERTVLGKSDIAEIGQEPGG